MKTISPALSKQSKYDDWLWAVNLEKGSFYNTSSSVRRFVPICVAIVDQRQACHNIPASSGANTAVRDWRRSNVNTRGFHYSSSLLSSAFNLSSCNRTVEKLQFSWKNE